MKNIIKQIWDESDRIIQELGASGLDDALKMLNEKEEQKYENETKNAILQKNSLPDL